MVKSLTPFHIREKIGARLTTIRQKRRLQSEMKRLGKELSKVKKFPDYGTSEDANIMEVEVFGENVSLKKKLDLLQKNNQKALKKIEDGSYGVCETCKKDIEEGRLKIFPSATECAACAKKKK